LTSLGAPSHKEASTVKIKCLRFECEVCSKVSSIQVFYNKSGEIKYARARHYIGIPNGKPQFGYHQQSLEYTQRKLSEMPKAEIGQVGQDLNVDQVKPESSSKLRSVAGPMGFATPKEHLSHLSLFFQNINFLNL
jgi:hypothetical protein